MSGEEEFEWDDDNIGHISRHDVEPWEAEEAILDPDRAGASARNVRGERRYAVVGATELGGCYLWFSPVGRMRLGW